MSTTKPVPSYESPMMEIAGSDCGRTVIWLSGEYDIATVDQVSDIMARAMALDAGDLVIDLSGVKFMDMATVGLLVRTRARLSNQSRSLALRAPSPSARRILGLCGFTSLIETGAGAGAEPDSGALGTWVAVPATERVGGAPNPPLAEIILTPAEDHATVPAGRVGP